VIGGGEWVGGKVNTKIARLGQVLESKNRQNVRGK
jgi:hypothetical protein